MTQITHSGMTWTVLDAYQRQDGWWRLLVERNGCEPLAIFREQWP